MEQDVDWLKEELSKLYQESSDYIERAYLIAIQDLLEEQELRRKNLEGQLEGDLWSPDSWSM